MKKTELRIGNLLYYNDNILHNQEDEVIEVFSIFDFGIISKEYGNSVMNDFESYKPIPLTEEWLLKFGFYDSISRWIDLIDNPNTEYSIDGKYPFNVQIDNGVFCFHYAELHYVHQLQNLYFALTGEELISKH